MINQFLVRFVIVVFGGAAIGLLVGAVGRYAFDASWNVFAVMAWGIMAGAIGLAFGYVLKDSWRRDPAVAEKRDPS